VGSGIRGVGPLIRGVGSGINGVRSVMKKLGSRIRDQRGGTLTLF